MTPELAALPETNKTSVDGSSQPPTTLLGPHARATLRFLSSSSCHLVKTMHCLQPQKSVHPDSATHRLSSSLKQAGMALLLAICLATTSASAWGILTTATTLNVSSNNVVVGTVVVFTSTVTDQNRAAVTSGQVKFCDATAKYCEDAALLGTAQLTSAGTAVLKLRLGLGSHSVKAVFAGTSLDGGSVSTAQAVTVSGQLPSTTAVGLSGGVGNYTLTAMVMGGGSAAPTGTVTFEDASNNNATVTTAALNAQTAVLVHRTVSYLYY
jgi:hypothetical protein